jgi:UDP-glucose 4-epimerase
LNNKFNQLQCFNLGNGDGFSVNQVIEKSKQIVLEDGFEIVVKDACKRQGDPAVLVADAKKAINVLNWKPVYNDLEMILRHAWNWEKTFLA